MKNMQKNSSSSYVKYIDWSILEISEEMEKDLLNEVLLKDQVILTTPEVFWGKDWNKNK